MSTTDSHEPPHRPESNWSTQLSVVLAAGDLTAPQAQEALRKFCEQYRPALLAYAGCLVKDTYAAEDLTGDFFVNLLGGNCLGQYDRARGKFRAFIKASFKNFMFKQMEYGEAKIRGGGTRHVSLSPGGDSTIHLIEPCDFQTAEAKGDRQWAVTVVEEALARLQDEYEAKREGRAFELLKKLLPKRGNRDADAPAVATIAAALGISPGTVDKRLTDMRKRLRAILTEIVAATVADPKDVKDEIDDLFRALGS